MAEAYKIRKRIPTSAPPPRQAALAFESTQSRGLSAPERQKAVKRLAQFLMQAAGISEERAHEP